MKKLASRLNAGKDSERIAHLTYELGRYQKKVKDQAEQIKGLSQLVDDYTAVLSETHAAVDHTMILVALKYGQADGDTIRLSLPRLLFADTISKYEVLGSAEGEAISGEYQLIVVKKAGEGAVQ